MFVSKNATRGTTRRRAMAGLAVVSVGVLAAGVVLAPAAEAAQWNALNGSVSSATTYYESSIDRHVTTANDTFKLNLSSLPSEGLSWFCSRASDGAVFTGYTSVINKNTNYTLGTGIQSGTVFHNQYKGRYHTGSFSGSEYY